MLFLFLNFKGNLNNLFKFTAIFFKETLSVGMIDAKIFSYSNETGLAIINKSGHYFLVNSVTTPLLWRIQSDSSLLFIFKLNLKN